MDIKKERSKFVCEICGDVASSIIYYHKYYPPDKSLTIEFPALICEKHKEEAERGRFSGRIIPRATTEMRGGREGFSFISAKELASLSVRQVRERILGVKDYVRNELASPYWRETVLKLRLLYGNNGGLYGTGRDGGRKRRIKGND